jgi:hypothetical protein
MVDAPVSLPDERTVFEGTTEERYLALVLETVVHDMSPAGDEDIAKQLGGYTIGEEPPPEAVPAYVELDGGTVTLSNPPFLMAEIDVSENGAYTLEISFDSDLQLLIDPPVSVTIQGSFEEVVGTLEQMCAEIYRTKGRRLEMIDAGVVGPEDFAARQ